MNANSKFETKVSGLQDHSSPFTKCLGLGLETGYQVSDSRQGSWLETKI